MTEGVTDSRPRGMYTRAFRRAEAEAQQPPPVRVPPVEAPAEAAPMLEAPLAASSVAAPPARPRRRRAPKPARRIASRPLQPRAAMTIAGVLVLAGMLAPLALSSSHDDSESPPAADTTMEIATARDIELPAASDTALALVATSAPAAARRDVEAPAARPRPADGGLVVETRPAGARVTVNGIGWGETPLKIGYLPFGTKRIRIIKDGYVTVERTVRIDPDTPRPRVQITLREQQ